MDNIFIIIGKITALVIGLLSVIYVWFKVDEYFDNKKCIIRNFRKWHK